MKKIIVFSILSVFLAACSQIEPKPFEPSTGHIKDQAGSAPTTAAPIPQVVDQEPILPEPSESPQLEKYTVVVNDVPVKELLFALARDAEVNVDITPGIEGSVTLNAVEQTLPQILDRISRQVDIRYEYRNGNLLVSADEPFLRTYKIDYVNMARTTDSQITIATQIATTGSGDVAGGSAAAGGGAGGGNNNSTTDVRSISFNSFWESLVLNVQAIIGEDVQAGTGQEGEVPISNNVIPSPETGVLTVKANSEQHRQIQGLLDKMMAGANRQVLVQATIVEVNLDNNYQAGIDWSFINNLAGISFSTVGLSTGVAASEALGTALGNAIGGVIRYQDTDFSNGDSLTATVDLLDEFGDTQILSSPQMMVLNNQTALLKVVENIVYFEVDADTTVNQNTTLTTVDTTAKTVPVGIVMSITPFVSENDSVILNVRPTISRRVRDVPDPNPNIPANAVNNVPQIAVREMESMLRLNNGEIAVLGGLMTDQNDDLDRGLPGVKDLPGIGDLFSSSRIQNSKTELVIFLRPIVVRNPSIDGDLDIYEPFLDGQLNYTGTTGGF